MIETTVAGILVFTGVIIALVLILNFAGSRLLPEGEVSILITNDESSAIRTRPGRTLLSALSGESVFLPSACGGGGTCAMCKCQVFDGGGEILPTETGHINRVEAKDHWRLACQVKIKSDMKIHVPEEIFSIQKWECTVVSNDNVATFIKELVLDLPEGEILNFQAGGYIQIEVPPHELSYKTFDIEEEYHEDWDRFSLWDITSKVDETVVRAYSMANYPGEEGIIMLNVRVASPPPRSPAGTPPGQVSSYIFDRKPGDAVTISGPFGEFFIKESQNEMIYIGGGAGMAPLRSHIYELFKERQTDRKVSFWYGARSLREMFYVEEFDALAAENLVAGPSLTSDEVVVDPHLVQRNMIVATPRTDGGDEPVLLPGNPIKMGTGWAMPVTLAQ